MRRRDRIVRVPLWIEATTGARMMTALTAPAISSSTPAPCPSWGMTRTSATRSTRAKLASVDRARPRTSGRARTARRCSERLTKSKPTSVADAVPATM
jgi:hypothetical protein